jgi:hypothetical protein
VRAIIFSLFLFACTGDYIDTFWSKDEQVNSCLPSVKYYWGLRGESVYLDDSGAEIIVTENAKCISGHATACINKERNDIQIDAWVMDTKRFCDVVGHEIGHGLGYQHSSTGLMSEYFPLDEEPFILPVYLDRPVGE